MKVYFILLLATAAIFPACTSSIEEAGQSVSDVTQPLCSATLFVEGQFLPAGLEPPERLQGGCWPFGTWSVHAEVADAGGCADMEIFPTYVYEVHADADYDTTIVYQGSDESAPILGIRQGGGGECQGTFEHFSADGHGVLRLKTYLAENQIEGRGTYELFDRPQ